MALSALLLPRVRFDLNPLNLKDPNTPSVRAFHTLAAEDSPYIIEVLAPDLAAAQARAARIDALPEVERAVTLASFVPTAQEEKLEIIDGMRLASSSLMAGAPAAPWSGARSR